MAVAWIAWRDIALVRESNAEFRSRCTHWVHQRWNEPINNGTEFAARKGWFLETWSEATTIRLSFLEPILISREKLPSTACMSVHEAERSLWKALSDGHLVAEAMNIEGRPIDVPQREWSYLKLFEDRNRDVLKYDASGDRASFTNVKFKRDDLLRLWPLPLPRRAIEDGSTWVVEPYMLEPILNVNVAGYVPLCAALQWIMISGGTQNLSLNDSGAWNSSVKTLFSLICAGEIELNGLPRGGALTERISGHALAVIRVLPPLHDSIGDVLLNAPSHIVCTPFVDQEHWVQDFNDKLYEQGQSRPTWTHLQVRKVDILNRWPRPAPTAKAQRDCYLWLLQQMKASPAKKPQSRKAFWLEAEAKFRALAKRQFIRAWDSAIAESDAHSWSKAGRLPTKSNRRTN